MSTENAPDPSRPADAPAPRKRLVPFLVVLVVMAIEGVAVFFLSRTISASPEKAVAAAHAEQHEAETNAENVELELAECRPSNRVSGKFLTFHVRVSVLVAKEHEERARALIQAKQGSLQDAVNTVFRGLEPIQFNEPGLETLRRKLRHEFDRVLGDDAVIQQVLIPQLLQSGPGV